jgi:hypothetical protein
LAASFCPRILNNNVKLWEDHIKIFMQVDAILYLVPVIPTPIPALLSVDSYGIVLKYFADNAIEVNSMINLGAVNDHKTMAVRNLFNS